MHHTAQPAAGDLLVAPPELQDSNFRRTVVLLCQHDEGGSFGLILNKPIRFKVRDLELDLQGEELVSLGGPVQSDTLHYLHTHGDFVTDAVHITGPVHLGGDLDAVRYLLASEVATASSLRFFLGYAGWSGGQLESEIRQGGWYVVRGMADLPFADDPAFLWRTVLIRMGGKYALQVNYPEDPRMN